MNCYPRNGKLRDHGRYYITRLFFFFGERYSPTTTIVLLFIYLIIY